MGRSAKRFRFSLRAAFIWTALLCLVLAAVMQVKRLRSDWDTLNYFRGPTPRVGPAKRFRPIRLQEVEYGGEPLPGWLAWTSPLRGRRVRKLTLLPIDDGDFNYVARFSALEEFKLYAIEGDGSTLGSGLAELARLRRLRVLDLNGANVTDESLRYLQGLDQLEKLNISFTYVTDEGIRHVMSLRNLRELDLSYTNCSDDGVKTLRQSLPNCNIPFIHYERLTPAEIEWNDRHAKELSLRRSRGTQ